MKLLTLGYKNATLSAQTSYRAGATFAFPNTSLLSSSSHPWALFIWPLHLPGLPSLTFLSTKPAQMLYLWTVPDCWVWHQPGEEDCSQELFLSLCPYFSRTIWEVVLGKCLEKDEGTVTKKCPAGDCKKHLSFLVYHELTSTNRINILNDSGEKNSWVIRVWPERKWKKIPSSSMPISLLHIALTMQFSISGPHYTLV